MKKRNVSRILRNLLVAVLIVSLLAVTAYAVAGFVIFDSPQDMISGLFGDKTGYDHKDVTHFTDPEKPGEVYDIPAYDRVPVDESVAASEAVPLVSPVGQSISWEGYHPDGGRQYVRSGDQMRRADLHFGESRRHCRLCITGER